MRFSRGGVKTITGGPTQHHLRHLSYFKLRFQHILVDVKRHIDRALKILYIVLKYQGLPNFL